MLCVWSLKPNPASVVNFSGALFSFGAERRASICCMAEGQFCLLLHGPMTEPMGPWRVRQISFICFRVLNTYNCNNAKNYVHYLCTYSNTIQTASNTGLNHFCIFKVVVVLCLRDLWGKGPPRPNKHIYEPPSHPHPAHTKYTPPLNSLTPPQRAPQDNGGSIFHPFPLMPSLLTPRYDSGACGDKGILWSRRKVEEGKGKRAARNVGRHVEVQLSLLS